MSFRVKSQVAFVVVCAAAAVSVVLALSSGSGHGVGHAGDSPPVGASGGVGVAGSGGGVGAAGSGAGFALAQTPPAAPAAGPVSLPDLAQVDILDARAISVLIRGEQGRSARIMVSVQRPGGAMRTAGSARLRLTHAGQTVPVRIGPGAVSALSSCAARRITAQVAVDGGPRRQIAGRLFLHPPACAQFFPAHSIWNMPLPRRFPLDPHTAGIVAQLARDARERAATVAIAQYSTPVYTVPAEQKRVSYTVTKASPIISLVRNEFAGGVPIPPRARPSKGTDGQLTVWQPATDTMWELYQARKVDGAWRGTWGAVMHHVSRSPGMYSRLPGGEYISTTASGLPLVGGLITLADLRRGRIDHALELSVPDTRHGQWSHPAGLSDGSAYGADAVPEGARFRLPAGLNISALHLPRLTAMLARAAQRYGIIVVDQGGSVAFRGQDPVGGSEWSAVLGAQKPYQAMASFPWSRLQLTRMLLAGSGLKPRPYVTSDGHTTSASPQQRRPPSCYLYGIPCS